MNFIYFVLSNSSVINRKVDSSQSSIVHMQVGFSIRTILAQATADDTIYVVTDTPSLYQCLPQVVVMPVSSQDIQEWRGPHDFFWRAKLMAMRLVAQKASGQPLMYLDGDTYLHGSLDEIKQLLAQGTGLMHKDEGSNARRKDNANRMWKTIVGHQYGDVTIADQHMYNAGVVAIPADVVMKTIDTALQLCDGMLDDHAEAVLVEQYSLSVALQACTKQMAEAKRWIGHYWHNKYYWSRYIARFFVRSYRRGDTVREDLEVIRRTNLKHVHWGILVKRTLAKFTGRMY